MSFDSWLTPPHILDKVRAVFNGHIDYDPASNYVAQKYVNATKFSILPEEWDGLSDPRVTLNGLNQQWLGNVFCNPPYSRGNIDSFAAKAIEEWNARYDDLDNDYYRPTNYVNQMILLVNSQTDTGWYHSLLNASSVTLVWRKRIKFWKIMNGEAHEKWEGEKSKAQGKGKIGNSPRYLNTMFYFGNNTRSFMDVFKDCGTFVGVKRESYY